MTFAALAAGRFTHTISSAMGFHYGFMAQITAVNIPWAQIVDFENGRVFLH
jgi:hypothetical protein